MRLEDRTAPAPTHADAVDPARTNSATSRHRCLSSSGASRYRSLPERPLCLLPSPPRHAERIAPPLSRPRRRDSSHARHGSARRSRTPESAHCRRARLPPALRIISQARPGPSSLHWPSSRAEFRCQLLGPFAVSRRLTRFDSASPSGDTGAP
ncbi:hypothetical protein BV25DRAFT_1825004 [Artomyces pyxidatus]|uniref:Uncharacterized protein n=1 Tax=Artomyces pyxidatus TaxID=48021 RepID=A0ACB8T2P2_9AGAM|nr:hypothetical protein BV25DRAFT_1825004 [Artomyces pyxidatus]